MSAQIDLAALKEKATAASESFWLTWTRDPAFVEACVPATILALIEAVERSRTAVFISCCDTDICDRANPDPNSDGCQGTEDGKCCRLNAMDALAAFRFPALVLPACPPPESSR